jgi:hypothetical protein
MKPELGFIPRREFLVLIVLVFAIALWWIVPTYRQARADASVKELRAKDGGFKIYESVELPAQRFDEFGEIRVPHAKSRGRDDEFFYTSEITWIVPEGPGVGDLAVWRGHDRLIRTRDNKLLGEAVYCGRHGGDPIGPWHPSSYGCPEKLDVKYLAQHVFTKQ